MTNESETIYKYPLSSMSTQEVMMPEHAVILTAQIQHGTLCLWAIVNPEAHVKGRQIEIIGTGWPMPGADRSYIATVPINNGEFIWHIFERL